MTRLKVAELTSGVGALVLGVGLGALFAMWIAPAAVLVTLAGIGLHAFGMWDKHRLEATSDVATGRWLLALYWACWLLLAGTILFLIIRR